MMKLLLDLLLNFGQAARETTRSISRITNRFVMLLLLLLLPLMMVIVMIESRLNFKSVLEHSLWFAQNEGGELRKKESNDALFLFCSGLSLVGFGFEFY